MLKLQKERLFSGGMQLQKKNRKGRRHKPSNRKCWNICNKYIQQDKRKNKIWWHIFLMHVDMGSNVTLIRKNFREKRDKPKLRKSNRQLKQFDGTVIKVMATFEGIFKTKKHFEMNPITVVACNKDYGLLRTDRLKIDTTNLINSIKAENNIRLLRGYKVSIHLKENHHPSYVESRKLFTFISYLW